MIEVSEIVVHEADEPDVVAYLFDPDFLAGEHGAEVDLLAVVTDATLVDDGGRPVVEGIFQLAQALIGSG
ncbi:MAG TPA: hypothetical protein QF572_03235 [Vicinamibacterales bacterium]|jgi:hypothetical protein|nr:hypothetical protein [Vicinamibacterales bacterium]|tara:strand:- start:428 stop:637 length:210 start_codon:yes stop_codon:yes gene_type:complete